MLQIFKMLQNRHICVHNMHTNELFNLPLPFFSACLATSSFYFEDEIPLTKEPNDRQETLLLLYTIKQVRF